MEQPQSRLVISTMKDEAPYVTEWLAYHRAIGFTDFLIYTNDCGDGTDLLLDRLQHLGLVRHERNKVLRRGPHKSALKYAKNHEAYQTADWVFVCDADEFLNIKLGEGRVDDLIERFPDADAIPITWRLFSNNGCEELYPGFVTASFTDAETVSHLTDKEGRFVKSLFKPCPEIERLGLHGPIFGEEMETPKKWASAWMERNPDDDPRRPSRNFGYEIAQINHYAVRSVDAFLIKRDRGRANHTKETLGSRYWKRWCRGGEMDVTIQRHSKAMQLEYGRICEDPIVEGIQAGSVQYHRKKLQSLLEKPEFLALRAELRALSRGEKKTEPVSEHPNTNETVALAVKAPNRHKNRLRMLEMMPKHGRCAEIGVWNGGFSGVILEVTQPVELVLIDPWDLLSGQGEEEWTHKKHKNNEFMRGMFDKVSEDYAHLPNISIRKGFSADVLASYPDDYFDWLYIDGNHLYEFVRQDIEVSFKKVRPGGIIAGDDYFWKKDGRAHVKEAVLDVMKDQGITKAVPRIVQQFMITVPMTGRPAR